MIERLEKKQKILYVPSFTVSRSAARLYGQLQKTEL